MNIDITYRGSMASCNYDCQYCPFAKTHDDLLARQKDQKALMDFVNWVEARAYKDRLKILISPQGEALIREYYREALIKLSHMPHVEKVVIQTNLSAPLDWLAQANAETLSLWTTYHPSEVSLKAFVAQTQKLKGLGFVYSVGIVGTKENKVISRRLRETVDSSVYLWVDAYKDLENYYTESDIRFYESIDPYFELNRHDHPSYGQPCRSACQAISVNHYGDVTPCLFIDEKLGNIYQQDLHEILHDRFYCSRQLCDRYVGYRHLKSLPIEEVYGDSDLERIAVCDLTR